MKIEAIKTRIMLPPRDDLPAVIKEAVRSLPERSVLVITSKVVSIWQGRCVPKAESVDKDTLAVREAEKYLPRDEVPGGWLMPSIKHNLFIASAGIDESNAADHYVLWPKDPNAAAKQLYDWARAHYGVKDLGVIITDSHTVPMRRGVIGVSLAYYGFVPLKDYRGTKDLFGREFKMEQSNVPDSLAAAAVMMMGEGAECTPLAVITDVPFVEFCEKPIISDKPFSSFEIPEQEDIYYPILSRVPWRRGRGGGS